MEVGFANAPSPDATGTSAYMAALIQAMGNTDSRLPMRSNRLNDDMYSRSVNVMRYQTEAFLDKQESTRITSSIMSSFDILKTMLQGIQ